MSAMKVIHQNISQLIADGLTTSAISIFERINAICCFILSLSALILALSSLIRALSATSEFKGNAESAPNYHFCFLMASQICIPIAKLFLSPTLKLSPICAGSG